MFIVFTSYQVNWFSTELTVNRVSHHGDFIQLTFWSVSSFLISMEKWHWKSKINFCCDLPSGEGCSPPSSMEISTARLKLHSVNPSPSFEKKEKEKKKMKKNERKCNTLGHDRLIQLKGSFQLFTKTILSVYKQ